MCQFEKFKNHLYLRKKKKVARHSIASANGILENRFMRLNVLQSNTNELVILIEKILQSGKNPWNTNTNIQHTKKQTMFNIASKRIEIGISKRWGVCVWASSTDRYATTSHRWLYECDKRLAFRVIRSTHTSPNRFIDVHFMPSYQWRMEQPVSMDDTFHWRNREEWWC